MIRLDDRRAAAVFVEPVPAVSPATANMAGGLVSALPVPLPPMLVLTGERRTRRGRDRLGVGTAGVRWCGPAPLSAVGIARRRTARRVVAVAW